MPFSSADLSKRLAATQLQQILLTRAALGTRARLCLPDVSLGMREGVIVVIPTTRP